MAKLAQTKPKWTHNTNTKYKLNNNNKLEPKKCNTSSSIVNSLKQRDALIMSSRVGDTQPC